MSGFHTSALNLPVGGGKTAKHNVQINV